MCLRLVLVKSKYQSLLLICTATIIPFACLHFLDRPPRKVTCAQQWYEYSIRVEIANEEIRNGYLLISPHQEAMADESSSSGIQSLGRCVISLVWVVSCQCACQAERNFELACNRVNPSLAYQVLASVGLAG